MVSQPDPPQRIARLTPLADVLARIDALVEPVTPRDMTRCRRARPHARRRLHAFLRCRRRRIALRDGWAVRSELTTDASSYAPVPLPAAARIDVGEPMPAGADAVAPLDARRAARRTRRADRPGRPRRRRAAHRARMPIAACRSCGQDSASVGRRAAVLAAAGVERLFVLRAARACRRAPRRDPVIDAAAGFVAGDIGAAGGTILSDGTALEAALTDAECRRGHRHRRHRQRPQRCQRGDARAPRPRRGARDRAGAGRDGGVRFGRAAAGPAAAGPARRGARACGW